MERLTVKRDDGRWALANNDRARPMEQMEKIPFAIDRLAAYEDAMPLERAQELAQAEKDRRLVVLPCKVKVGDTVWTNIAIVGDRYRSADKPYPVNVVFIGMGGHSDFFHVQYSNGRIFPFDFDKIGKTVFLTREEAEAALKKREADDEKSHSD